MNLCTAYRTPLYSLLFSAALLTTGCSDIPGYGSLESLVGYDNASEPSEEAEEAEVAEETGRVYRGLRTSR